MTQQDCTPGSRQQACVHTWASAERGKAAHPFLLRRHCEGQRRPCACDRIGTCVPQVAHAQVATAYNARVAAGRDPAAAHRPQRMHDGQQASESPAAMLPLCCATEALCAWMVPEDSCSVLQRRPKTSAMHAAGDTAADQLAGTQASSPGSPTSLQPWEASLFAFDRPPVRHSGAPNKPGRRSICEVNAVRMHVMQ